MRNNPSVLYQRAVKRTQRVRAKIDRALYGGQAPDKHLLDCYFDNVNLVQSLSNMVFQNAVEQEKVRIE